MSKRATEDSKLTELKNAMRGANKNAKTVLSKLKHHGDPADFAKLVAWIRKTPSIANKVFPQAFPQSVADLNAGLEHEAADVNRELFWAVTFLKHHTQKIEQFLIAARDLEGAILQDRLTEAGRILARIEHAYGQSLWLIKKKILVLQLTGGLAIQKAYVETLKESLRPGSLVAYIAYHVSARAEPTFTISRFYSRARKSIAGPQIPGQIRGYLSYHIAPGPDLFRALPEILSLESRNPVVDYAEAVRFAAQLLSLHGLATPALAADPFFRMLLRLDDAISEVHAECVELWASGSEGIAYQKLIAHLAEHPLDGAAADLAVLASATMAHTPEPMQSPLGSRLLSRRAALAAGKPTRVEDGAELEKVAAPALGQSWANSILAHLDQESDENPLGAGSRLALLPSLGGLHLSPAHVVTQQSWEASRSAAAKLLVTETREPLRRLWAFLASDDAPATGLRYDFATLVSAKRAFARGEHELALGLANGLRECAAPIFRRRATQLAVACLRSLGRVGEALERTVDECLQVQAISSIMPIRDLAEQIGRDRADASPLCAAILLDLASRPFGRDHESACVFALMDTLEDYGVELPSSLVAKKEQIGTLRLVHFLRHVCVESVMDRTGIFPTSKAVLDERVLICRALIELDAENLESYQVEIRGLLRRLMLQKRMRQVEQSKIFVDIESIKRHGVEKLRESVLRFFSLAQKNSEGESKRLVGHASKLLPIPASESRELLSEIVAVFREEYTTSPEHGLDKYLSVRIRHGTLASHLRRSLEAAHLVTLKEPASDSYRANEFWPPVVALDAPAVGNVQRRLARFSRDFDTLVDDIKSWVHITSDTNSRGMFSFGLTPQWLDMVEVRVRQAVDFDDFISILAGVFDDILTLRLERIREELLNTAKIRASELLDGLARDVSLMDGTNEGPIANAIRSAKTDLLVNFDRLAAWFNRAHTADMDPFMLADAVEICVQTVRAVAPTFAAVINDNDIQVQFEGRLLGFFVDVLFIAFDNCARHSGLDEPRVTVKVERLEHTVEITVENKISPDVDLARIRAAVENIRADINAGLSESSVRREGGSGLHKLRKLLAHDLGVREAVRFGLSDDSSAFHVQFRIKAKVIPDADSAR